MADDYNDFGNNSKTKITLEKSGSKKRNILLSLSLLVLLAAGSVVYFDVNIGFLEQIVKGENDIARIKRRGNIVRVKDVGDLKFREVPEGELLFNNQQLYTGDQSYATVVFKDNSVLEVQDNSLIVLRQNDEEFSVDLDYGVMFAQVNESTDSKLKIRSGDDEFVAQGKGAQVQISSGKGKESQITVTKGTLDISRNGKKIKVKEGEQLNISKDGKERVTKNKVTLLSPKNFALFKTKSELNSQNHQWKFYGEEKLESKILLSRYSDFKEIEASATTKQESWKYQKIRPGKYYWKIMINGQDASPIFTYSILNTAAPMPLSPKNNEVFKLVNGKLAKPVELLWQDTNQKQAFQLIINKDGKQFADRKPTKNSYALNSLKSGDYSWRVRSLISKGAWSNESFFKVIDHIIKKNDLAITRPLNDQEIKVTVTSTEGLLIQWDQDITSKYLLEIARAADEKVFLRKETNENKLIVPWRLLHPFTEYTLKVSDLSQARKMDNTTIEPSRPQKLNFKVNIGAMEVIQPLDNQRVVLVKKGDMYEFQWGNFSRVFPGSEVLYRIDIARDKEFKEIIVQKDVEENYLRWAPESLGVYYWRISAKIKTDVKNKPVAINIPRSSTIPFLISKPPRLPAPTLPPVLNLKIEYRDARFSPGPSRSPAAEEKIDVIVNVPIETETSFYYDRFYYEIYSDEDLSQRVFAVKTKKTKFIWKAPAAGTYYLRAAYIDGWGEIGELSTQTVFQVEQLERDLAKARLLTPDDNFETYSDQQVNFRWSPVKGASQYELQVSDDNDFDNILLSRELNRTSYSLAPRSLIDDKDYYWRVKAKSNQKHLKTSSSDYHEFEYLQVAQIAQEVDQIAQFEQDFKTEKNLDRVEEEEAIFDSRNSLQFGLGILNRLNAFSWSSLQNENTNYSTNNIQGDAQSDTSYNLMLNYDGHSDMGIDYSLKFDYSFLTIQGQNSGIYNLLGSVGYEENMLIGIEAVLGYSSDALLDSDPGTQQSILQSLTYIPAGIGIYKRFALFNYQFHVYGRYLVPLSFSYTSPRTNVEISELSSIIEYGGSWQFNADWFVGLSSRIYLIEGTNSAGSISDLIFNIGHIF